jgi:hypothetical protein
MRVIIFDLPAGREDFLHRLAETNEMCGVELAANAEFDHISALPWKRKHRLSFVPADAPGNLAEFERFLRGDPARIVTFNEGAIDTCLLLQNRFCDGAHRAVSHQCYQRHKAKVRQLLRDAGVSGPEFFLSTDVESLNAEMLESPKLWVAKPALGMGGRCVRLVSGLKEAQKYMSEVAGLQTLYPAGNQALNLSLYWGTGGESIFEEFIPGQEFSAEVTVSEGVVISCEFTKKFTSQAPYFVELAHLTIDIEQFGYRKEDLTREIQKVCGALGVHSAVCHLEFKLNEKGFCLIEANLRPAGGDICEIWRKANGRDLLREHLFPQRAASGEKLAKMQKFTPCAVIHHTMFGSRQPSRDSLSDLEEKANACEIAFHTKVLKSLSEVHSPINSEVSFRFARSFLSHDSASQLDAFVTSFLEADLKRQEEK